MSIEVFDPQVEQEEQAVASGLHGEIGMLVGSQLVHYVYPRKLGRVFGAQTAFKVGGTPPMRQPDVAFVTLERMPKPLDEDVPFPPDLAVEVISRTDDWSAIVEKVKQYQQAGVRLIWVIDPYGRDVFVYHPGDLAPKILSVNDELDGETVIPGFKLAVNTFFE